MSDTFPKWTNHLPRNLIIGAVLVGTRVVLGSTYYFTPKYSRVGYMPAPAYSVFPQHSRWSARARLPLLPQRRGEILVFKYPGDFHLHELS